MKAEHRVNKKDTLHSKKMQRVFVHIEHGNKRTDEKRMFCEKLIFHKTLKMRFSLQRLDPTLILFGRQDKIQFQGMLRKVTEMFFCVYGKEKMREVHCHHSMDLKG